MDTIISTIRKKIDNLKESGFYYVVISDSMAKMVTLIGGMIMVRMLTKSDYGLYSYVTNATSILLLLGDFGASYAFFQYAQENLKSEQKVNGYFKYGAKISVIASVVSGLILIGSPFFYPYVLEGASGIVMLLCLTPLLRNMLLYLQTNLRVHMWYKGFAAQNFFYITISYATMIIMAHIWAGKGAIFSQYISEFLGCIFLIILNYKVICLNNDKCEEILTEERRQFKKFAISMKANDIISTVMTLIDVFLIGIVFKDEDVIASYKVATIIPSAVTFIPNSLMVYSMPLFVQNNKNYQWVLSRTKQLMIIMLGLCGTIALCGIFAANWILPLIFGEQYNSISECYIALMINFVIVGGIQVPIANIMTTQKIVRYKMIVLLGCGILNVILDIVFIYGLGSIGAAIATTMISVLSVLAYVVFFFKRMNHLARMNMC